MDVRSQRRLHKYNILSDGFDGLTLESNSRLQDLHALGDKK